MSVRIWILTYLIGFLSLGAAAQVEEDFNEKNSSETTTDSVVVDQAGDELAGLSDSLAVQPADSLKKKKKKKKPKKERVKLPPDTIPRPTIHAGVGMLHFYGDIKSNEDANTSPLLGNLGINVGMSQKLNDAFDLRLNLLYGHLSSNERSIDRNLNFRTRIFSAGVGATYNFDHFLNKGRRLSPYISVGIENIQFSTKVDLIDEFGNEYHYWSDGSIRNISEDSPFADRSILIQRDYVYETAAREENFDGEGNYGESTLGIPIGVGFNLRVTSKVDFNFETAYHFTFTDYLDNVTVNSTGDRIGNRPGNDKNDKFLYTGLSVHYNFTRSATGKKEIEDQWDPQDLIAFGNDDYDGDGVYDFVDECPQTPFGVEVDERGCPLYESGPPTLTDEEIYQRYLAYLDSTGLFATIERRAYSSDKPGGFRLKKPKRNFKIKLGEFVGGVPDDIQSQLLGLPDVESHIYGDTTVFTVGNYDNLPDAIKRKIDVGVEGFEDAEIVMMDENGRIRNLGDEGGNIDLTGAEGPSYRSPFLFRVQLGAFKEKKPDEAFTHVENLVVVENEGGFTKYMSGAFENYKDAARHRIEMLDDGWNGAFVVAYKRGQGRRLTMNEAGVTMEVVEQAQQELAVEQGKPLANPIPIETPKEPEFDKSRIKFKIQIGIYKNQVPPDVLADYMKYNKLSDITLDDSGVSSRYTSGEFSDYQSALEYRNKLIEKGFQTAFIIAIKDGTDLIPIEEARKLLGELDE